VSLGAYILTYPGDFHLSSSLIQSLRHFHPDLPIMIIPGEGFNRADHPFDVEVMPEPEGFWRRVGHQSRDFWAFQGPFEKFLYLDADVEYKFIHWAGVPRPRPSVFCERGLRWLDPYIHKFDDYRKYAAFPEIPGYEVWQHFQQKRQYPMRTTDRLSYSYADLKRLARSVKSKVEARLSL